MFISLSPEGIDSAETLRGAIHRGRHLANHNNATSNQRSVTKGVENILVQNLDLDIATLIAMPDLGGAPDILKIVTDKKNHNALSINTLINIMSYLQVLGSMSKEIRKLREKTSKLLEAKRNIPGVAQIGK